MSSTPGTPIKKYPTNIAGRPTSTYAKNATLASVGRLTVSVCTPMHTSPITPTSTTERRCTAIALGLSALSGLVLAAFHAGQSAPIKPATIAPEPASTAGHQLSTSPARSWSRRK